MNILNFSIKILATLTILMAPSAISIQRAQAQPEHNATVSLRRVGVKVELDACYLHSENTYYEFRGQLNLSMQGEYPASYGDLPHQWSTPGTLILRRSIEDLTADESKFLFGSHDKEFQGRFISPQSEETAFFRGESDWLGYGETLLDDEYGGRWRPDTLNRCHASLHQLSVNPGQ